MKGRPRAILAAAPSSTRSERHYHILGERTLVDIDADDFRLGLLALPNHDLDPIRPILELEGIALAAKFRRGTRTTGTAARRLPSATTRSLLFSDRWNLPPSCSGPIRVCRNILFTFDTGTPPCVTSTRMPRRLPRRRTAPRSW